MNIEHKYIICTKKRLEQNKEYYDKVFPDFKIFQAVEGKNIEESYLTEIVNPITLLQIKNNFCYTEKDINHINSVGSALSHYKLWKKCIEYNKPLLICEDDIELTKEVDEKLNIIIDKYLKNDSDKGIFFLYSLIHSKIIHKKKFNEDYIQMDEYLLENSLGLQAYIITPKIAEILIKNFFPITIHVDWYISVLSQLNKIKLYFISDIYFQERGINCSSSNYLFYKKPLNIHLGYFKILVIGFFILNLLSIIIRFITIIYIIFIN